MNNKRVKNGLSLSLVGGIINLIMSIIYLLNDIRDLILIYGGLQHIFVPLVIIFPIIIAGIIGMTGAIVGLRGKKTGIIERGLIGSGLEC